MASSNPSKVYDPLRKEWVKERPEESIRQKLLKKMVEELGYPSAFLVVEKELSALPHLRLTPRHEIPQRRADIICFAKDIHSEHALYPLLMIECKAVALTPKVAQQVIGYNEKVGAFFLSVANQQRILTGSYDTEQGMFRFREGLPSFVELMQQLRDKNRVEQ